MNHAISKQLNKIADTTPIVYKWDMEPITFKGWELKLTPLGDLKVFIDDQDYSVMMPVLIGTEHKQQFKDAYKKGGWMAVKEYHREVINSIKK
jgi:hypothetical protein